MRPAAALTSESRPPAREPRRAPQAPGPSRRERRRAEERLAILRAAARTFRVRGYAAAGMREIAAAAGLSAANLYHYFAAKDELLFFCQDLALDRLLEGLATARKARGPVEPRLHALAVGHVLCLIDEVEGSVAHFEVDALPAKLRTALVAKRDRYERGVRGLVALGVRRGELRRCDLTFATRAFLGALNWTALWFRPEGSRGPREVAGHVADYAVAGLTGRAAPGLPSAARRRGAGIPPEDSSGAARDAARR